MAVICPTVLAREPHEFREQMERIGPFAQRIQIDVSDGKFAPVRTVEVERLWWPRNLGVDVHVMYQQPDDILEHLLTLKPNMVIVHAEADGNFVEIARKLHAAHIKAGIALLADTDPTVMRPAIEHIDHVLLFSGDLGNFGGKADLSLLDKVKAIRTMKANIEIGWDGGVNDQNAKDLAVGGVDVLNAGGFIQQAEQPADAYAKLVKAVEVL